MFRDESALKFGEGEPLIPLIWIELTWLFDRHFMVSSLDRMDRIYTPVVPKCVPCSCYLFSSLEGQL